MRLQDDSGASLFLNMDVGIGGKGGRVEGTLLHLTPCKTWKMVAYRLRNGLKSPHFLTWAGKLNLIISNIEGPTGESRFPLHSKDKAPVTGAFFF